MLFYARLGVSRLIYVNVDSPNLGFPYFNFLGGYQLKKHPVYIEFLLGPMPQCVTTAPNHNATLCIWYVLQIPIET